MNGYRVVWGVAVALLLSGCLTAIPGMGNVDNGRPAWIDNPGNGVSASAGVHVKGRVAQEELAILRARQEYAKRFGVTIEAVQAFSTSVANGRSNTVGAGAVAEGTSQKDVKAMVKEKWRDPDDDVLWVWLVPSN